MRKILVFDTETTGLFDFKKPAEDPEQPHIVQIAASLEEEDSGIKLATMDLIVKPDGWVIPDEVAMLHGISQEMAMDCGLKGAGVLTMFLALAERADILVAHNVEFDRKMIKRDLFHYQMAHAPRAPEFFEKEIYCTKRNSTGLIKSDRPNKWPKLSECVMHFFKEEMLGAHSAMIDVQYCSRVYQELRKVKKDL